MIPCIFIVPGRARLRAPVLRTDTGYRPPGESPRALSAQQLGGAMPRAVSAIQNQAEHSAAQGFAAVMRNRFRATANETGRRCLPALRADTAYGRRWWLS